MQEVGIRRYCEDRLKRMIIKDKEDIPHKVSNILKAELLYVLKNYLEIEDHNFDIDIIVTENGRYKLIIEAECRNIKRVLYIE